MLKCQLLVEELSPLGRVINSHSVTSFDNFENRLDLLKVTRLF